MSLCSHQEFRDEVIAYCGLVGFGCRSLSIVSMTTQSFGHYFFEESVAALLNRLLGPSEHCTASCISLLVLRISPPCHH
eukprot:4641473-Amphidinium_carterae.1